MTKMLHIFDKQAVLDHTSSI